MYWRRLTFSAAILALACWAGCGPQVSREELGEVTFDLTTVPESQRPFILVELQELHQEGSTE